MSQPPQHPPAGQPRSGGQYEPPAGFELKKKKKKKWPWILGAVVLLIVIVSATSNGGTTGAGTQAQQPRQPAPGPQGKQSASSGITYEVVSGNGKGTAMIAYTSGKNFNQAQENGARLPWTKTVDLGGTFFTGATVVAQAGQGVESITCRVKEGAEVLTENTSTGQFAVVTCSGS